MTRTVLVTGASSGIGLATAVELARRGYRSIGSVRSEQKAAVVAAAADEAGVEVETVQFDVTDADAVARTLSSLRLYALVNNAGYGLTGAVEDVDDGEVRRLFETMVFAPMRLARLALPAMREDGGGRIVNVSSIYGVATGPLTGWYQAAKHALEAVSDALRLEVAGAGVKVVLVEPGGFKTGIWDDLDRDVEAHAGSRLGGAYRRTVQLTRLAGPIMGQPEQCAKVIARAVSARAPRARYVVGYDAQVLAAADRLTPTMVKDRVLRTLMGL
jgi:NAD(P)-dependent dehydrogenase (short-subunit alcohol dehydrogenase family)